MAAILYSLTTDITSKRVTNTYGCKSVCECIHMNVCVMCAFICVCVCVVCVCVFMCACVNV